jgi:hypothetical protein
MRKITNPLPRQGQQVPPTREALAGYTELVKDVVFGERSQFNESSKTREQVLEILAAADREPNQLAADCDQMRRRWR